MTVQPIISDSNYLRLQLSATAIIGGDFQPLIRPHASIRIFIICLSESLIIGAYFQITVPRRFKSDSLCT